MAMPTANSKAILLKTTSPAANIQGMFNKSGAPKRFKRAAAGKTAIGAIIDFDSFCRFGKKSFLNFTRITSQNDG